MYKGIFWLIVDLAGEEKLQTIKFICDSQGYPLVPVSFSSKSGNNYNHQVECLKFPTRLTQGKPYNYFPRGRVEIKNGNATVYCHPCLTQEPYRNRIIQEFSIPLDSRFVADGSRHYQAHMR